MDKQFMIEQLAARIRESAQVAMREHEAAAEEARDGADHDAAGDDECRNHENSVRRFCAAL
jgi:hypothetical protein